jgi:hypothetical protein
MKHRIIYVNNVDVITIEVVWDLIKMIMKLLIKKKKKKTVEVVWAFWPI